MYSFAMPPKTAAASWLLRNRCVQPGHMVHMDVGGLSPGAVWRSDLSQMMRISDFVFVCASSNWSRPGYMNREVREAKSLALERPFNSRFIVPIHLGPLQDVPAALRDALDRYQWSTPEKAVTALDSGGSAPLGGPPAAGSTADDLSVPALLAEYLAGFEVFFDPVERDGQAVLERARADGTPPFRYPEATAFAILNLLFLFELTGDCGHLERAHACAHWLCSPAVLDDEFGGVLARVFTQPDDRQKAQQDFGGRCLCLFDTAICLKAISVLCDYAPHGHEAYRQPCSRMAKFVHEMLESHTPIRQADSSGDPTDQERWSKRFGPFLTKAADALLTYAALLKDASYLQQVRDVALACCDGFLAAQHPRGNFETSKGFTDLHAHCYAMEGLLAVGRALHDERLISHAQLAVEWALDLWSKDGRGLPQIVAADTSEDVRPPHRSDAIAQTLLVGTQLWREHRLAQHHVDILGQLARFLLQARAQGAELNLPKHRDAWYTRYGYLTKPAANDQPSSTLSSWCNFFAFEGLARFGIASLVARSRAIVLAGGDGKRAWPVSCRFRPKALATVLLGDRSPLQETVERLRQVLRPDQIYVIVGRSAVGEARHQLRRQAIHADHVLSEADPQGSVDALTAVLSEAPIDKDALLVVSMADGVFDPPAAFTGVLERALISAHYDEAIVSMGLLAVWTANPELQDGRFGYMTFDSDRQLWPLGAFEVSRFIEKPTTNTDWSRLNAGRLALECGTLVMTRSICGVALRHRAETTGSLATDLLERGDDSRARAVRLLVAPLPNDTQFDDVGALGSQLKRLDRFHTSRRPEMWRTTNLCLGEAGNIELLACERCIVVADNAKVRAYGLRDHLIVNSSETRTAVVVPLAHAYHGIKELRNAAVSVGGYKHFIETREHPLFPPSFTLKSSTSDADATDGVVGLFGCQHLRVHRDETKLVVTNTSYPPLETSPDGFLVLCTREKDDPQLVRHLIDVARLADALLEKGRFAVTPDARRCLRIAALYHDFGGTLDADKEEIERTIRDELRKRSLLDWKMLESHIAERLLPAEGTLKSTKDLWRLIEDSAPSATDFLSKRSNLSHTFDEGNEGVEALIERDIITLIIATQEEPETFDTLLIKFDQERARRNWHPTPGLTASEIRIVFGCLKTADNLVAARWRWKRSKGSFLLAGPRTRTGGLRVHV